MTSLATVAAYLIFGRTVSSVMDMASTAPGTTLFVAGSSCIVPVAFVPPAVVGLAPA